MQARRGGGEGRSAATVWWLLRRGVARPLGRADAILGGEQRCRTQIAARNNWLRGKRLDRSITNTAVMIGRYEHITFLAVSRSESDEADRPRRRLSASVFFVLSALTALQTSHPGAPSHRRTRGAGHTHATPPPSHGPVTHTISGGKRPAGQSTQAGNHSHTQRPPTDASGRAITRHGPTRQQSHSNFHTRDQRGTRLGHRRPTR